MVDTLRLLQSEDVGKDEASVESLLKKHKVTAASFTVHYGLVKLF